MWRITRPLILWALHWMAMRYLLGFACVAQPAVGPDIFRVVAGAMTLGTALLALAWLVRAARQVSLSDRTEAPHRGARMAGGTAAISLLGMLAGLAPVIGGYACSG